MIVTVSVESSVVIDIPLPATSVSVSVDESATTLFCPDTAIVVKLLEAAPSTDAFIVIVSVPSSVVIVTFDPATKVNVSVEESATTLFCPSTAIVVKAFAAFAVFVIVITPSASDVVAIPVPPTN